LQNGEFGLRLQRGITLPARQRWLFRGGTPKHRVCMNPRWETSGSAIPELRVRAALHRGRFVTPCVESIARTIFTGPYRVT